jgi:NAD(P)-binding Rossmann-like domain
MRINIVGAGMAGLLAANMLRRHDVIVYEKQKELPNNHSAVLRFKTPEVGEVLGIQFRKVNMVKTYIHYKNKVADSLSYSMKCTGEYRSDRSIIDGTIVSERYVAPPDLIEQMSKNIEIKYGIEYIFKEKNLPIISTIPMPILMRMLHYENDITFKSTPGVVATATIEDCLAYVSILVPSPKEPYSRISITGDKLIVEYPGLEYITFESDISNVYDELGLYYGKIKNLKFNKQKYFKITEINDAERKKFLRWATVHYNIYSLGRYATWRPKLLLDDLVKDVRKIENWITHGL